MQIWEDGLQRLWITGQFVQGDWELEDGRKFRVVERGDWNRGTGPDVQGALLEIQGVRISGDIEIHLYAEDWIRHHHCSDANYNQVILHVVGFRGMEGGIQREDGQWVPEWWCGPWMNKDWEGLMAADWRESVDYRSALLNWSIRTETESALQVLQSGARERWKFKVGHAAHWSVERGWQGAFRRLLLYALGYPDNRGVFLEMADSLEDGDWKNSTVDDFRFRFGERISWSCGRPGNRAEDRLRRYIQFCKESAPETEKWLNESGPELRQTLEDLWGRGRRPLRVWWEELLGRNFQGSWPDRFMVDCLLPFLVGTRRLPDWLGEEIWLGWYAPGIPERFRESLKVLGVGKRNRPLSNGWIQGLIRQEEKLLLERLADGFPVPLTKNIL